MLKNNALGTKSVKHKHYKTKKADINSLPYLGIKPGTTIGITIRVSVFKYKYINTIFKTTRKDKHICTGSNSTFD